MGKSIDQDYDYTIEDIIQVVNISPDATLEQMRTLFRSIDEIDQIKLYPIVREPYNFSVCYIKYKNPSSTKIAKHLTNVVFIDRPLIVLSYDCDTIPDEDNNLKMFDEYSKFATIFNPNVVTHVVTGVGGIQVFATSDLKLAQTNVAPYPNLPMTTDPSKIEEIRRTLYIGNLDSTVPVDKVMEFFANIGEVKFIRLAGNENQPTRFAFVEYYNQASIAGALVNNGTILGTKTLKINHSNNAIVKILPQPKLVAASMLENRSDDSRYARDSDRNRSRSRDQNHLSRDRDKVSRSRHRRGDSSSNSSNNRDRSRDNRYHRQDRDWDRARRDRPRSRDKERDRPRNSSRDRNRDRTRDDGDRHREREAPARSRSRSGSRDGGRKRHRKHSPLAKHKSSSSHGQR